MNRKEQRAQTEARVREHATRLFRERGFDGTSIRDIAQAAGVSVGTVIAQGDKASLFLDAVEQLITTASLEILESDRPFPERLRALLHVMTDHSHGQTLTQDYLVAFLRARPTADNRKRLQEVMDALVTSWARYLGVPHDDPRARTRAFEFYATALGTSFATAAGALDQATAATLLDGMVDDVAARPPLVG